MASGIDPKLRIQKELIGWLYLMQHHGLPTRLLDWSESPLVALYFCVCDVSLHTHDGTVWGIEPSEINMAEFGEKKLFGVGTAEVKAISSAALRDIKSDESRKVAAIMVDRNTSRHMMQYAQCTIHGREEPLNENSQIKSKLIKIDISSGKKPLIKHWLEIFQINRQTLFPDMDNLAKYIMSCQKHDR